MLVDLSHPLRTGMRVYPGDPAVSITPALTVASQSVNILTVHLGSQSGTHVDAPFHVRDDLPDLDALPLDRFVGPAVLVDVRDRAPRDPMGPRIFDQVADRLAPGVVVLLVTGWDVYWEDGPGDRYLAHPWPTPEAAERLVAAGVRTLGIDALSVDRTTGPEEAADSPEAIAAAALPTHLVLAGAGCVIAENLRGLAPLLERQKDGDRIEISLLPLRIAGGDGAPVRAVATVRPAGSG